MPPTQNLQLAPEAALFAADAVHGTRHLLKMGLQFCHERGRVRPLPQTPLVKWYGARRLQCLVLYLPPGALD